MKLIVINTTGRHCYIGHLNHSGIVIEPVTKVIGPQQFDLPENLVPYFSRAINTMMPLATVLTGEEADAFASALIESAIPVEPPAPEGEQPPIVEPVIEPVIEPAPTVIEQQAEVPAVSTQQEEVPAPAPEAAPAVTESQEEAPAAVSKAKKSTRQKQE